MRVKTGRFSETGVKTTTGRPVFARVSFVEAGQAVSNMAADDTPHLCIPDNEV